MTNNESMEMYLETIYILEKNHGHAHVVDIAKQLEVSKPSVTKAIKSLKVQELVDMQKYGTVTLTELGNQEAKRIYRNHKLLAIFLRHSLDLTYSQASQDACKIEHVLSSEMMESVEKYLIKHELLNEYYD